MDKQKQIEEMGNIVFKSRYKNDYIFPLKAANELYNAGYRKIPENAVVLTREEYEELKSLAEGHCEYCYLMDLPDFESERLVRDTTRKETAKKIYQMADEIATGSQNDGVNILCAIAKEFGL